MTQLTKEYRLVYKSGKPVTAAFQDEDRLIGYQRLIGSSSQWKNVRVQERNKDIEIPPGERIGTFGWKEVA